MTRRGGALSVVLLVCLLLLAAACGGGSNGGASSDANGSPTTSASGGSTASCIDLATRFASALAVVSPSLGSTSTSMDWTGLVAGLDALTSSMPSSIRDDWTTYVDAVRRYADAMKGLDLSKLATDPTAVARISAASAALEDPRVESAVDSINAYFAATCPGAG